MAYWQNSKLLEVEDKINILLITKQRVKYKNDSQLSSTKNILKSICKTKIFVKGYRFSLLLNVWAKT